MIVDRCSIEAAKEKLGDRNAELIADILHLKNYSEKRKIGSCPSGTHTDSTPSFSYFQKAHEFICFACGMKVDLIDAYIMTGSTFLEACEKLFAEAGMEYNFTAKGSRAQRYYYPQPSYAASKDKVYEYLSNRGISRETVDYLGIQQDTSGNIIFQFVDDNDVLVGCKIRPSRVIDKSKGERKCWWLTDSKGVPYDKRMLLYNRNKINPSQPLIITSGELDCATCIECGMLNAASIPSGDNAMQWIAEEWDFLNNFNSIVLVHDNDKSGEQFAKDVSRRLGEYRVKVVEIPQAITLKNGDRVQVKDLNQYLVYQGKDAVRLAITTAKETEIPSVVDYTDIKQFDMSDVDGFQSGFKELDRALGKFYMGTTTIITGIASAGKSSFLSTLICQSVEQGFPAFVYSGELSNPSLKNWVDSVFVGQRWLNEYQSNGFKYYRIKNSAAQKINEYYKNQILFYRDSFDHKASNLLSTMESVVRKHGVKTIVLDNMTSIDLENDDNNRWNKMDDFVRSIIDFAKKWHVAIFLVLHPRKMDMVRHMNLFDLMGVASSSALSHRILSLYRVPPKEHDGVMGYGGKWKVPPVPWDVVVDVLKDRYGSATNKSVGLYYDVPSRRFFDSVENLDYKYAWDKEEGQAGPLPFPPNIVDESEVYGVARQC